MSDDATKSHVRDVFDDIASKKNWENLYRTETWTRLSYNFISRQRAVEAMLAPHAVASAKVLDLGCGTGDLLPFFVRQRCDYTGADYSPAMIERARANYARETAAHPARFVEADCEKLPFSDGQFDLIASIALIEYLPDANRALDEMRRVLKPGGKLLLTVPHKSCINFAIRDILAPLRKLLFPLYLKLQRGELARMRDVKHRGYDPGELGGLVAARGFRKLDEHFGNFYFIPHPFDHIVPKTYIRLSEWADLDAARNRKFQRLAANYIALYAL